VRHHPYKDLESGIYRVLSNIYSDVVVLKSPGDAEVIRAKGIRFVFVPKITPFSNSDSVLTWPPTSFRIDIECNALDAEGKTVAQVNVSGTGAATFDEFRGNFSLSAQRAADDVLRKLQAALLAEPKLQ